jgi:hypothetical protein
MTALHSLTGGADVGPSPMNDALPGMRRMVLLLTAGAVTLWILALACFALLPPSYAGPGSVALGVAALFAAVPAWGGWIALERQSRLQAGAPDLYNEYNASRDETAVSAGAMPNWSFLRRWIAGRVFGHRYLVGDRVRVKDLAAIRATLDEQDRLNGMPFMQEMAAYCGREMRVYRVVDKIYDYGKSRLMRSVDDAVLLIGLRCDGSAHGGCQAACYLIWKTDWLEPVGASAAPAGAGGQDAQVPADAATQDRYRCQYTDLTDASRAAFDWRRIVGPWIVGNVTASAFSVALLTRAFNALQSRRGGVCYPWQPTAGNDMSLTGTPLRSGDWVRVCTSAQIARSLDKNSKNKGLWFDRDMLKHCGLTYRVRGRVEKIIDVNSGAMIPMKTACIVLEGVHYSGEFQMFGEQHDFLYWREAWLEPVARAHSP